MKSLLETNPFFFQLLPFSQHEIPGEIPISLEFIVSVV